MTQHTDVGIWTVNLCIQKPTLWPLDKYAPLLFIFVPFLEKNALIYKCYFLRKVEFISWEMHFRVDDRQLY